MRRAVMFLAAVMAAGVASGCRADQTEVAVERQDSSGVLIVHTVINDETAWPSCALTPEPLVRIGSQDASPENELYQVEDALRLPDGRIAIVNRGTDELRIFNDSGELEFSVGREGEGPGEFQDPIAVSVLAPDSLVVWDWDLGRLSVFTNQGAFVRSIRPQPAVLHPTGYFGISSSDPPLVIASWDARFPTGSDFVPQLLRLLRYDRHGTMIDTVATLPYGTRAMVGGPRRTQMGSPLFEGRGVFAVVGDHFVTANGTDPEVKLWGFDATLRRLTRWQSPDRTVSSAEVDAYRSNALARANVDFVRQMIRAENETMPVSPEFPAVWDVKGDPAGFLWVRRYPRPNSDVNTWLGFDSGGAFHCVLAVSRRYTILEFGEDYVLGRTIGELDVEYVALFGLNKLVSR